MKTIIALIALCIALPLGAQEPQVDRDEILRLGDMVQHIDGSIQDAGQTAFVAAMGPPESDIDKWFISVLTMRGCAPCARLKQDWQRDPYLLALANPDDPKTSWAHFKYYSREDRSQAFRFDALRVTAYPTIIVQPPRSGAYGPAKTVVFQGQYGGNPEKLARQITDAIKRYIAERAPTPPPVPLNRDRQHGQEAASTQYSAPGTQPEAAVAEQPPAEPLFSAGYEPYGLDPPWEPDPRVEPSMPNILPIFPDDKPLIPPFKPTVTIEPGGGMLTTGLIALLMSLLTLGAATAAPWLLTQYREYRKQQQQPTLLTDDQFQKLIDLVKEAATQKPKT